MRRVTVERGQSEPETVEAWHPFCDEEHLGVSDRKLLTLERMGTRSE